MKPRITGSSPIERYVRIKKTLSSREKKLKFVMFKKISRQDEGKEKPCPLGTRLQECELVNLMLEAIREGEESLASMIMHGDMIPHLVTWHCKEIEHLVIQDIEDILKRR